MNLEQMEHVVKVASEGSITKAAEKLHITNSGLSQSISQLENELGITIFNRSRKGTVVTTEGQVVIIRAKNILNNIKLLNDELLEIKNNKTTHIKILATPTFLFILQQASSIFYSETDNITMDLLEKSPNMIMESIKEGDFDLCFTSLPLGVVINENNINYELIQKDKICIVVGKNSPLYSLDYVTHGDLKNQEILIYKNSSDFLIQKIINSNNNKVKMTSNQINIILEVVKNGKAFVYSHSSASKSHSEILNGNLKMIPILEDNDFIYKDLWAIYPKNKKLSKVGKQIIEIVKKLTNE